MRMFMFTLTLVNFSILGNAQDKSTDPQAGWGAQIDPDGDCVFTVKKK